MPLVSWGPRVFDFFVPELTTGNYFSHDLKEYEEPEIVILESSMNVEQVYYKYFVCM